MNTVNKIKGNYKSLAWENLDNNDKKKMVY
jgi:hypothetical protein